MYIKNLIIALFLVMTLSAAASSPARAANEIKSIEYHGNIRIPDETIFAYLDLNKGDQIDQNILDEATKNLFKTGFFSDVSMTLANKVLKVEVIENPMINKTLFDGNQKLDEEDLEPEVNLKPRSILSPAKVQEDVNRLIQLYHSRGRYSVKVTPKIVKLDQNRVNLIYEIDEGPEAVIRNIIFDGNAAYSSGALAGIIMSKEYAWYRFFSSASVYDPDKMRYDAELLRRFYFNHGFADFKVTSKIAELAPAKDAFIMTFVIDEGYVYNYNNFAIDCSIKKVNISRLEEVISLKTGGIFNQEDIDSTVDAIVDVLGDMGYPFVDVDPLLEKDPVSRTVNVTFRIREEYKAYINRINIKNNTRTLDKVIRREFKIAEGDPYNVSKIQRSKQKIEDLNFFQKVEFKNVRTDDPDKMDIDVEVEETSTGGLNFMGGYNTSTGPLASVTLTEQNFLGKGQEVSIGGTVAQKESDYAISFTEPKFMDKNLAAGFDVFTSTHNSQKESSFSSAKKGFALRAGYNITEYLSHGVSYSYRKERIYKISPIASKYIKAQAGKYYISSIGQSFVYDRRDSHTEPKNGYLLRFDEEIAGIGGNTKYTAFGVGSIYYKSFYKNRLTFIAKADAGTKNGYNGQKIRIADRYFLGQEQVRGFDYAGIGPRDMSSKDKEALGGKRFYTTTLEMRFPLGLPEELKVQGAVFHDAASVYGIDDKTNPAIKDTSKIRASFGSSVYWKSPMGNIGLHYGIPYKRQKFDKIERFNITFSSAF